MIASDVNPTEVENRDGEYQAVSGWAIAAFVLAVFSVSAFVAPMLWAVPLAAVTCAIIAMWRIKYSRGELIGWNLAVLALLLALMFGVAAPTRMVTRWIWLKQRAEIFAQEFITLLQQNQPYAAHELTLSPGQRQKSPDAVQAAYAAEPKMLDRYNGFLKQEPVKTILEHGIRASVEPVASFMLPPRDSADDIGLRYRISYPSNGPTNSFEAALVLERSTADQQERWVVLRSTKLEDAQ
jgi:hypothetical protein